MTAHHVETKPDISGGKNKNQNLKQKPESKENKVTFLIKKKRCHFCVWSIQPKIDNIQGISTNQITCLF